MCSRWTDMSTTHGLKLPFGLVSWGSRCHFELHYHWWWSAVRQTASMDWKCLTSLVKMELRPEVSVESYVYRDKSLSTVRMDSPCYAEVPHDRRNLMTGVDTEDSCERELRFAITLTPAMLWSLWNPQSTLLQQSVRQRLSAHWGKKIIMASVSLYSIAPDVMKIGWLYRGFIHLWIVYCCCVNFNGCFADAFIT